MLCLTFRQFLLFIITSRSLHIGVYDISSLVPRPAFFVGRWKSEGPGTSCMRMHLIRHEMMNDVIIKTYVARAHSISAAES